MKRLYKPSAYCRAHKESIEDAYKKLEYKEWVKITKLAKKLTEATKLSMAQAIELIGKIGIYMVEEK